MKKVIWVILACIIITFFFSCKEKRYSFEGRVLWPDGQTPMANVRVYLLPEMVDGLFAYTDAAGYYIINGIPPREYKINLDSAYISNAPYNLSLFSDQSVDLVCLRIYLPHEVCCSVVSDNIRLVRYNFHELFLGTNIHVVWDVGMNSHPTMRRIPNNFTWSEYDAGGITEEIAQEFQEIDVTMVELLSCTNGILVESTKPCGNRLGLWFNYSYWY